MEEEEGNKGESKNEAQGDRSGFGKASIRYNKVHGFGG
jgi:hypothetical protein